VSKNTRNCGDFLVSKGYSIHDAHIIEWADQEKYCTKMKPLTRIARILDGNLESYMNVLKSGKIIIDKETESQAIELSAGIRSNAQISEIIDARTDTQKYIEFEYKDEKCKGYIDLISERVFDFKVTSQPVIKAARQYRWDIQGAFYNIPLELPNPGFIVARTYAPDRPMLLYMSDEDMDIAINGKTTNSGYRIEGVNDLIDRYKWHRDNDKWDYSREYYQNQLLNLYT
jgi:hypothetical protein